ncbi:Soluble NSF Attachment Protein (SNAP) Receptor (SNARE) [Ectocarpus siliculosus]|uniref:Soluble NSF Attachment Protein (SNAP) Receptor (SNARE) n=1 Tax=Ectocarpus siliculosus TaxID=2880 RepID=D8LIS8_ECTSI|nr:Soluble NSF Attachment Protein (SNAP) Receptor (SNARE) [Ectocarpus siliculosus]|eukprot:CBN79451.1 Soluble NSF Attachment Protein (SNAP) Receptor (SNARE) [Ectocarpus siliculosus]
MTDRTDDFRLIAAALPPQPRRASPHPPKPKRPAAAGGAAGAGGVAHQVSTLGEFHSAASSIAKSIHKVSQKLEHLTKLVQQRGLFNDPVAEINSLVHVIKQEMQDLNTELDASQTYVNRRKQEMGDRNQAANHSVNVVGQLKMELINTAKTFKNVLQQRSNNLKAQKDHREMFVGSQSSTLALAPPPAYRPLGISPLKPSGENGNGRSSLGGGQGANGGPPPGGALGAAGGVGGSPLPRPGQVTSYPEAEQEASADTPLIAAQGQQQQQQQQFMQMQLASGNQGYLESRSSAVQEVEGHIAELGLIFNKLATMLQDQREMVESVHDNVEDAGESVNQGHLALLNTMRSLSSNRRLALSVSGILLLFALFFFVFLV